ncbi:MAG: ribonuclease HI family protein [Candidatus Heimdallarchaeaceae archaeon]
MVEKKCNEIKLFVDGCSKGNPGKAGVGYVIKDMTGQTLDEGSKYLGDHITNNQAEYQAVIIGLDKCSEFCRGRVCVLSDSELIVKQMNKVYRIKNAKLKKLFLEVKEKELFFEEVNYSHIRRERNQRADELANKAIDSLYK